MMRRAILTFPMLTGLGAVAAAAAPLPAATVTPAMHVAAGSNGTVGGGRPSSRTEASVQAKLIDANIRSTIEPAAAFYVGAVQVYPWTEGSLYRLYAAPGEVSDIMLQAGESLVSVASGDTARWMVAETSSGTGATKHIHILVKPVASGLSTNLLIATDRRVYHVELQSIARSAMASIAWTYPDDGLLALKAAAEQREEAVTSDTLVEALNFNYRIEGDHVAWRPLRAFDDGHQVFIEFPPDLGNGEAPPLFVRGPNAEAQLINYRVRGHYYVADRLFLAAELRLGGKHQQIVRIVRDVRRGRRSS